MTEGPAPEAKLRQVGRRQLEGHPPFLYRDYRATIKRAPEKDLVSVVRTLSESTGPGLPWAALNAADSDLTTNAGTGGEAIGPRTIVTGRVVDDRGEPIPSTLIEIWQANACGRYVHWREVDFPAPLDPNFLGVGQCLTDGDGTYRFLTIRPGPYPWGNHPNAWRPSHIHFSLHGASWDSRLVTQMYFPGDPLLALDPIHNSVPEHARRRMIAAYDHSVSVENWALGYRFDIVLQGPDATPFEGTGDPPETVQE